MEPFRAHRWPKDSLPSNGMAGIGWILLPWPGNPTDLESTDLESTEESMEDSTDWPPRQATNQLLQRHQPGFPKSWTYP